MSSIESDDTLIDKLLIEQAQADPEQFAVLYQKYTDRIFQFIYYRVNNDRETALDLTAEVFMRALRTIHAFTWQGLPYSAYLYRIARSVCIEQYSKHQPLIDISDIDIPDTQQSPNEAAEITLIWKKISTFPKDTQELFELHYLEGLSYEEIGSLLNKKPSSLRTTMTRAIATLRKYYETT